MKKTFLITLILTVGLLVAGGVLTNLVSAGGRVDEQPRYADGLQTATTTYTYLSSAATASTTKVFSISNSERSDLNICATASSSAATLQFKFFFSTDPDSNKTWFGEDGLTINSGTSITHSVGAPVHDWNLATTTVDTNYVCKSINIPNTSARFFQLKMGVVGANTGVWYYLVPQIGQ